jgi:Predicted membrane protein (DUF2232)
MVQFWLQIGLIGLGAGTCSALLFASVPSGSILSVVLFYVAPMPIAIAALGWSHWAALAAALVAALGLTAALGPFYFPAFLISVGLPAWWLGYLALLARPAEPGGELEWYPPGRLVLWAAILGALVIMAALSQLGGDEATIRATLRAAIDAMFRAQMHVPAGETLTIPGVSDPDQLRDVLVIAVPPAAAVLITITLLLNLWLAGRIVNISGRLRRPWPDLAAMRFPATTPALLAAAAAASFLPDVAGLAASLPAANLLFAYAVLGFAVLHGITRDLPSRAIMLVGIYSVVVIFRWPVLLIVLLGLIDAALDLRRRVAAMRGPPSPLA